MKAPRWLFRNRHRYEWWRWTSYLGFAIAYPSTPFTRQQQRQALIELLGRNVTRREAEQLSPALMAAIPERLADLASLIRTALKLADELHGCLPPVQVSRRQQDLMLARFDLQMAFGWAESSLVDVDEALYPRVPAGARRGKHAANR